MCETIPPSNRKVLDCGSLLPLAIAGPRPKAAEGCRTPGRKRSSAVKAFTLTELLIVIAALALLATTQLPALSRAKAPVRFTQCMNNLRQIGQATILYKAENNDAYPYGNRCMGSGTGVGSVVDPYTWPRQLLRYLGGYRANVQPLTYTCPSEQGIASDWQFQVHYVANRLMFYDTADMLDPVIGAMVRTPSIYWMFIEKDPQGFCSVRPGGLANPILIAWNYPPGFPGYRRHNGGLTAAAADGHVDWLRLPRYQPGSPAPPNLLELGDCANGQNPPSTWVDFNPRVKLFSRYSTTPTPGGF